MPFNSGDLRVRIAEALQSRERPAEALPRALTAAALKSCLGSLADGAPDLGLWRRFQTRAGRPGDDSVARENLKFGYVWANAGNYTRARDYLQDAIEEAIAAGSADSCAAALVGLISIELQSNNYGGSIAAALEALKFLERHPTPDAVEALCSNLASVLSRLSAFPLAIEVSAHGAQAALDNENDEALAMPLNQMSDAYRMGHLREEALRFGALAFEASEVAPPHLRASIEVGYASALCRAGQMEEALTRCTHSYDEAIKVNDHETACRALILKGTIRRAYGEINNGLEAYHRAADLARQTGLEYYAITAEVSLGEIYLALNDPERALTYFRNVRALNKQARMFDPAGWEMFHIAVCYRAMGKTEQAEQSLETLASIYASTNQKALLALCLSGISQIQKERGELDEALSSMLRALQIAEHVPEDTRGMIAPLWLKLSSLHKERGERPEAQDALRRVDEAYPQGPRGTLLPEYYLTRAWLAEGDGTEAVRRTLYEGIDELRRLRNTLPYATPRQLEGLAGEENLFDALISLEAERLNATELYMLCQRYRARRLIELLSKADLPSPPQVEPAVVERERALLAALRERIADLLDPNETYWEAHDQIRYDALLAELRGLWNDMQSTAPAYVAVRFGAVPEFPQLLQLMTPTWK